VNLEYIGHQKLQAIIDEVEAKMPVGYIRTDWMKPDSEPFEIKAFVLEQLGLIHTIMCEGHVHAPGPMKDGRPSPECPYCDYVGSFF
jgi:hypothetical protein